jgi:MFS family permease
VLQAALKRRFKPLSEPRTGARALLWPDPPMRKYVPLLSAEFLFFLGMWLSKTAWPLWFHESGDMRIYGISYSVMALTGALSVGVGNLVHRYGVPLSIRAGVGLYALGIGLRWFNQSLLAGVLSGVFGGLGASTVILALRTNARWLQDSGTSPKFLAARNMASQAATGLAGVLVGLFLGFSSRFGTQIAVLSGVIPLLVMFALSGWIFKEDAAQSVEVKKASTSLMESYRLLHLNPRTRMLLILSTLCGLYTALSAPFFPLLYLDSGLTPSNVAFLGTLAAITGFASQPFSAWVSRRLRPLVGFVLGEGIYAASILFLLFSQQFFWIALLILFRSMGRALSLLSEQIIEIGAVKKEQAATFYGAVQTTFLLGDSLGGAAGGFLVSSLGVRWTIASTVGLVALHVVSMVWIYREEALLGAATEPA